MGLAVKMAIEGSEYRSISRFARELGESRDKLYNRIMGRTSMDEPTLKRIRALLGKPTDWPYSEVSESRPLERMPMAPIQIVGTAMAGPGDESNDPNESIMVPAHMARVDSRAFIVENDSMFPHLMPGDVVIIQQRKVPRFNRVNLFYDENGKPRLKELRQKGGRMIAHSYNPDYADEAARGDIAGMLIGVYRVQGFREEMYFDPEGLEFHENF